MFSILLQNVTEEKVSVIDYKASKENSVQGYCIYEGNNKKWLPYYLL